MQWKMDDTLPQSQLPQLYKIGIIDIDLLDNGTRHPNLALMKISGYLKKRGHDCTLIFSDAMLNDLDKYDLLIASKVFTFSKIPSQIHMYIGGKTKWIGHNISIITQIEEMKKSTGEVLGSRVIIGGTGFFPDGGICLDEEIEHHMPDYDLYKNYVDKMIKEGRARSYFSDYLDYSIGFTTRGCFRKCDFCVNKKYDRAELHSPINEFLDKDRPMIYLWDDNFFAMFKGWEKILEELDATGKPFQFRQGLDIRLLTPHHAERLSKSRYHGDFIFAFDHIEDKELIEKKLSLWRKYSRKTTKLYVLCAFDSWNNWDGKSEIVPLEQLDIENTFERIKVLMEYGCLPYIMRYETYKKSKYRGLYTQIARWCNQPQFFKKKSFRQFCEANQEYQGNKESICSAYQSMLDFEKERPDLALKYFDLRFDELNRYQVISKYSHKETYPCTLCKEERITWDDVIQDLVTPSEFITAYMLGDLDFACLDLSLNPECSSTVDQYAIRIVAGLKILSIGDIINCLDSSENLKDIDIITIPQFSNTFDATEKMLEVLSDGRQMTYLELGTVLDNGHIKKDSARRKYGENHSKLASLLDIVWINDSPRGKVISISPLGKQLLSLNFDERAKLFVKLYLRIPIVQHLLKENVQDSVNISSLLQTVMTKKTTIERRKASILNILEIIGESNDITAIERISKIN